VLGAENFAPRVRVRIGLAANEDDGAHCRPRSTGAGGRPRPAEAHLEKGRRRDRRHGVRRSKKITDAAAEKVGLARESLSRALNKPHIAEFTRQKVIRALALASVRASPSL